MLIDVTIQPPCRMGFARSDRILLLDHSSMIVSWVTSVIIAAENCPSFVTDAIYSGGMIRWNTLHHDVLPESRGPATTSFLVFCGILNAKRH